MSAGMVIVGAGEAGTRAALTLRRQNYSGPVTLLSAENRPPYERPPLARELMYGTGEAAAPRPIVPRGPRRERSRRGRRRTRRGGGRAWP